MEKAFYKLKIAIIAAFLINVACNNENKVNADIVKNPISADGTVDSSLLPKMVFEKELHDFGNITQGEKVSYEFKFTNTGKTDLIIQNASASCGCTVPEYPKTPIKPGESNYMKVVFDSNGKSGVTKKEVTIVTNCIPNTQVIAISANISTSKP